MSRFEDFSVQYETINVMGKKTTRTISGLIRNTANEAADTNGQDAATKIDTFMRAFVAMSNNTYSGTTLIGKADVINLMEV